MLGMCEVPINHEQDPSDAFTLRYLHLEIGFESESPLTLETTPFYDKSSSRSRRRPRSRSLIRDDGFPVLLMFLAQQVTRRKPLFFFEEDA